MNYSCMKKTTGESMVYSAPERFILDSVHGWIKFCIGLNPKKFEANTLHKNDIQLSS